MADYHQLVSKAAEERQQRRKELKNAYLAGVRRAMAVVLSQSGIESITNDPERVNDANRIHVQRAYCLAHLLGVSGFVTHREVAEKLGIERAQVSEALAKMRKKLREDGVDLLTT